MDKPKELTAQEYFNLYDEYTHNEGARNIATSYDKLVFMHVFVKSRMPELAQLIENNFANEEGQIYAHQQVLDMCKQFEQDWLAQDPDREL